jgi:hypothetical protein
LRRDAEAVRVLEWLLEARRSVLHVVPSNFSSEMSSYDADNKRRNLEVDHAVVGIGS